MTSLLREIQIAAVNSDVELPTLLRKCKILAARLGNPDFKEWIENEINGYPDEAKIPDYRIIPVISKGNFSSKRGDQIKNAPLPLNCLPKEARQHFSEIYLGQSVASIDASVKGANGNQHLIQPWPQEIVAIVADKIIQNYYCMEAWKVIPLPNFVSILDAVRNKVLDFVLEIESLSPTAGEADIDSPSIPQEKITQTFNTYITGNVQNVATASSHFKQEAINTSENEKLFDSLLEALANSKEDKVIIKELTNLIEEMRAAQGTNKFTSAYQQFMGIVSDHVTVFSVIAPFLGALTGLISS